MSKVLPSLELLLWALDFAPLGLLLLHLYFTETRFMFLYQKQHY